MKKLYIIGSFLLFSLTFSCISNKNKSKDLQTEVEPIKVNFTDSILKGSHILKSCKAIAFSAKDDNALIVNINRILVGKERYFVMDRQGNQLIAFNENGDFIATTKKLEGEGPNNYIRIMDATIDNAAQKIYVHCDAPYCMMAFDMNLQLLEKVNLDYYMTEITSDDNFIYGLRMKSASEKGYELLALDKTNLSDKPTLILESSKIIYGIGAFGKGLTSYSQGINVCFPFDNVIYQISNKEITACYPMNFGTKDVDYNDIKDMNANQFFNSPYRQKIWSVVNVYSSDSTVLFGCNDLYFFVLDVASRKCDGFSSFRNDLMPYSNTQAIPVGGLDNTYAYQCPLKYVGRIKKHIEEKMNTGMKKILNEYDEEDNPVIILCELK